MQNSTAPAYEAPAIEEIDNDGQPILTAPLNSVM